MNQPAPSSILVVDDHRPTRQSLCLLLRDVGYFCSTAPTATDARLLLQPDSTAPSLIILDLWMPHEDGESLLAWIRAQPHLAATHVIIYSAAPEHDHRDRLLSAGAADFIPKPTPIPHLLVRLSRFAQPNTMGISLPPIPTPTS